MVLCLISCRRQGSSILGLWLSCFPYVGFSDFFQKTGVSVRRRKTGPRGGRCLLVSPALPVPSPAPGAVTAADLPGPPARCMLRRPGVFSVTGVCPRACVFLSEATAWAGPRPRCLGSPVFGVFPFSAHFSSSARLWQEFVGAAPLQEGSVTGSQRQGPTPLHMSRLWCETQSRQVGLLNKRQHQVSRVPVLCMVREGQGHMWGRCGTQFY